MQVLLLRRPQLMRQLAQYEELLLLSLSLSIATGPSLPCELVLRLHEEVLLLLLRRRRVLLQQSNSDTTNRGVAWRATTTTRGGGG